MSQDLLKSKRVKYGDILYVPGYGYRVVNDCMNKRHTNSIDLLVNSRKEEKAVGVKKLLVYVVKRP